MKRYFLPILFPVVLLVGCDNPDQKQTNTAANPRTTRITPSVREQAEEASSAPDAIAAAEQTPDTPESLRENLNSALQMESVPNRERALANIAWNALEIDPSLAFQAFQNLPAESAEKISLIRHYAMRAAEQDFEAALVWAAEAGSDQEISSAVGQIAVVLAESNPQRAAELISEFGIAGREFDVSAVQVLQRWAAHSPSDAAAWVVMFPPGAARVAGIKVLAGQWLKVDPQSAFSWLPTLQDAEVRAEAALALQEAVLVQPQQTRDEWLTFADDKMQVELSRHLDKALSEVGDNVR